MAEVVIFSYVLLFQRSTFYSFFRRHCDVALFSHHLGLSGPCSFCAYPFNRSVVPSFQVLSSYQVLPSFSTGVPSKIVLTLCAILSIVPEAVCCWFHQVSSHLVKFMFNSVHLQSECCPNYIILIPSLSCFNRSIVAIIPLLNGVSSKCFHFAKFIFYAFHFQPECCRNWSLSFLVHLVSSRVLACTSCPLQPFFLCLSTYKVLVMFLVPLV